MGGNSDLVDRFLKLIGVDTYAFQVPQLALDSVDALINSIDALIVFVVQTDVDTGQFLSARDVRCSLEPWSFTSARAERRYQQLTRSMAARHRTICSAPRSDARSVIFHSQKWCSP